MVQIILISLVAILHVYFLVLEMFLWTKPLGLKAFRMKLEHAEDSRVLASNMGLYNGFLAAGLFWSLLQPNPIFASQIAVFFLACILVAAFYGGYSVGKKILIVQGVPAALALLTFFI